MLARPSILRRLGVRCSPWPASHSYSTTTGSHKAKSPHAQWYADIVPAMIPIALLGSAVYLGLQLAQSHLSHEKYLDQARVRVRELEAEIDALQNANRAGQKDIQDLPAIPVATRSRSSSRK